MKEAVKVDAQMEAKYIERGSIHWRRAFIGWRDLLSLSTFGIAVNPRHSLRISGRYSAVMSLMPCLKDNVVLDVGCGDGVLCHLIAKQGARMYGIDDSKTAIGLALHNTSKRKYIYRPSFSVASCTQLPFADESFDYLTLLEVIEHLEDPLSTLAQARRVLKCGGKLILTTPRKSEDGRLWSRFHVKEYTEGELLQLLKSHFREVELFYLVRNLYENLFKFRLFGKRVFRPPMILASLVGLNPFAFVTSRSGKSFLHLLAVAQK